MSRFSALLVISAAISLTACANFQMDGNEAEPQEKIEVTKEAPLEPSTTSTPVAAAPPETPAKQDEADLVLPVYPYKRDQSEPKSIEVQIVKPDGTPSITESSDPNLVAGGVGTAGESVVLMPKSKAAKTAPAAAAAFEAPAIPAGIPADKALGWLKNGNTRFVKGSVRRDGQSARDRKRVSAGATPHAVVLACSESVAPPEIIFDQKLGEISVVRNFGGEMNDSAVRSIEESVKQGSHLIVVLDHSGCGAKSGHHAAASELAAKSKMLDALVKSGDVSIKTAIYNQDDGRVTF